MAHPGVSGHDTEGTGNASNDRHPGCILRADDPDSMQLGETGHEQSAAKTAAPATALSELAGTAVGTASVKPRNGLIAFMRPSTAAYSP
jgi:hypothetical protein